MLGILSFYNRHLTGFNDKAPCGARKLYFATSTLWCERTLFLHLVMRIQESTTKARDDEAGLQGVPMRSLSTGFLDHFLLGNEYADCVVAKP